MATEYEILDEKTYSDSEKQLCDWLTRLCGVKICLGYGPTSWCDGDRRIVLDKKEASSALHNASTGRFDLSFSDLCEKLSHLIAHLTKGEEHNIEFYKEQAAALCQMFQNFTKTIKYTIKHPNIKYKKKIKILEKTLLVKSSSLMERVIKSLTEVVNGVQKVNDDEIEIIERNIHWGDYIKLMRILKQWENNFPDKIIVRRGKRHTKIN